MTAFVFQLYHVIREIQPMLYFFLGFHVSKTEIEKLILSQLNGIELILLTANCEVLQIQQFLILDILLHLKQQVQQLRMKKMY
jgi:hypothetical protein